MSRLNEDTYTSSEEDEYVFDEPEAPEKSTPIESVKKQSKTTEVIEETLNFDEELSENGTELESGTGVEIQTEIGMEADDSGSESEYEEVVIRKRVKKKKTTQSRTKATNLKSTNLKSTPEASSNEQLLSSFINQMEGVDPFNFQVIAPGQ